MSSPQIRRADRAMSDQRMLETLARGYSGRLVAGAAVASWPLGASAQLVRADEVIE